MQMNKEFLSNLKHKRSLNIHLRNIFFCVRVYFYSTCESGISYHQCAAFQICLIYHNFFHLHLNLVRRYFLCFVFTFFLFFIQKCIDAAYKKNVDKSVFTVYIFFSSQSEPNFYQPTDF